MTFVQLEYIVALDTYRHFALAAEQCHVTQPTLSMQIGKLEQDLGLKIFDRSKQPVLPTEAGIEIIEKARQLLTGRDALLDAVDSHKGLVNGELKIGIIPTLAPYLLPLFLRSFTQNFPEVKLTVSELTTQLLVNYLREGRIDVGHHSRKKGSVKKYCFTRNWCPMFHATMLPFRKTMCLPVILTPINSGSWKKAIVSVHRS